MCGSDLRGTRHALLAFALLALAGCGGEERGDTTATAAPAASPGSAPANAAGPGAAETGVAASAPAATPAAAAPADVPGDRVLQQPEDLQLLMLAYRLQGRPPPIADWAAANVAAAYANEFDRPRLLAEDTARLQEIYDGTAGVGGLRLNVRADLSEYDAARGGFYLDAYLPGSSIAFEARPAAHPVRPERVSLAVVNDEELNFWALDPATARQVLERNGGARNVVLDSRFRILGAARRGDGVVLDVQLLGYAINSDRYNDASRLGELRFDGGP